MEKEHDEAPHLRPIQKALAEELTIRVHSREDYDAAVEASQILFGKGTTDTLKKLSEDMLLSVFEGVPQSEVPADVIKSGIGILEFLAEATDIFASKGEARRMIKDNAVSVNKEKIKDDYSISENDLLNGKYVLIQKGKKNYFLVRVV
jgi:tyrosyl-tRNA synthetase